MTKWFLNKTVSGYLNLHFEKKNQRETLKCSKNSI